MKDGSTQSSFDRWWWRAWYMFVALAIAWLVWCAWLARPIAPWTQGWVGWWTGGKMGCRPNWNFNVHTEEGSTVDLVEGNPVFRTGGAASVALGHWGVEDDRWTWAAWVRIHSPKGSWPTNFLVLRVAQSPDFELQLGFEAGRPRAVLTQLSNTSGQPSMKFELSDDQVVPLSQWVHLTLSVDREFQRLLVNGVPVKEHRGYLSKSIALAQLRLTGLVHVSSNEDGTSHRCEVEHDDVVAFDRVVPPEELADLAARGRGAWALEQERSARAARIWRAGALLALLALAGLFLVRLVVRSRGQLAHGIRVLLQPPYRAVRWTLIAGVTISALLAGNVAVQARRADEQRFAELLHRFVKDADADWDRLAGLLVRARDWISAQTNLTQDSWETWLHANRFPYATPGALGIGYAEQVLPDHIAAHEARWSARHGFDYRVHPPRSVPRRPVVELEGDPRLPVVLYRAPKLDRRAWFTNHTILGRDLLFQSLDDPRSWAEARRVEEVAARNEVQTSSLEEIAPAAWYGKPIQGLRLYVPWTLRTKPDHPTHILEASAWHGVLFASVSVEGELQERFGSAPSPIGFRLYTGKEGGERLDLVADSSNFLPDTADRPDAWLRRTVEMRFYYRRLFLDAWTTGAFEAQSLRRWAWIAGAAGGGLTLLMASLLVVQIRAREAQSRVLERLRVANAELLLAHSERERLSRDLHDGSIQNLYGLGLHLQRVQSLLAASPDRARSELNDSLSMLDQSIEELRRFILTAGVDHLPQHTVTSALEGLVERLRKTTSIDLQLHVDKQAASLTPRTGVEVLHIVREAVSNALRHADARHIEVTLERINGESNGRQDQWRLTVVDDGHGFDVEHVNGHGRGLKNLASRAAELGGRSETQSNPGMGTRVIVEFPG